MKYGTLYKLSNFRGNNSMKTLGKQLKQTGISLLEVLLSLAIIAIILVMAMQYFSTASNNQRLNMVRTFIGADMAAIQGFGVNNNGFTTDGTTAMTWSDLVNYGYLSKDTKSLACDESNSCKQMTPWGDEVLLGVDGNSVTLTVPLPDNTLCNNLVQSYGSNVVQCGKDGSTATVYVNGYATTT